MLFSELLEFHKQILFGIHIAVKRFFLFMLLESFHLAVKLYLPSFGKTKSSFDANLLKILSSKSVRFYSSICFIRFSMNTAGLLTPSQDLAVLVVGLDGLEPSTSRLSGARSNHLSYRPVLSFGRKSSLLLPPCPCGLVEMRGIEPLTPCLQSRCSPG